MAAFAAIPTFSVANFISEANLPIEFFGSAVIFGFKVMEKLLSPLWLSTTTRLSLQTFFIPNSLFYGTQGTPWCWGCVEASLGQKEDIPTSLSSPPVLPFLVQLLQYGHNSLAINHRLLYKKFQNNLFISFFIYSNFNIIPNFSCPPCILNYKPEGLNWSNENYLWW